MDRYQEFQFRSDDRSPDYFLWRVFSSWQREKNKLIAQLDLTSPQMTVLTSIYWLIQNKESTIQTKIADAANMDRMTTSTVLRTLQKKDLVLRKEHHTDTRAKAVALTPRGIDVTIKALKTVDQYNIQYFSALGDSREAFIHLLQKLLKHNKMHTEHLSKYQTIIKAPVEKVWEALTRPELVKKYFFGSNQETDWKVGSAVTWTGDYEGQTYVDKGVVLEFSPNQKLSHSYLSSWSGLEDSPENHLYVTYELKKVKNGTELTITQSNYDEEKARHSEGNWKVVVDGLKNLVE